LKLVNPLWIHDSNTLGVRKSPTKYIIKKTLTELLHENKKRKYRDFKSPDEKVSEMQPAKTAKIKKSKIDTNNEGKHKDIKSFITEHDKTHGNEKSNMPNMLADSIFTKLFSEAKQANNKEKDEKTSNKHESSLNGDKKWLQSLLTQNGFKVINTKKESHKDIKDVKDIKNETNETKDIKDNNEFKKLNKIYQTNNYDESKQEKLIKQNYISEFLGRISTKSTREITQSSTKSAFKYHDKYHDNNNIKSHLASKSQSCKKRSVSGLKSGFKDVPRAFKYHDNNNIKSHLGSKSQSCKKRPVSALKSGFKDVPRLNPYFTNTGTKKERISKSPAFKSR